MHIVKKKLGGTIIYTRTLTGGCCWCKWTQKTFYNPKSNEGVVRAKVRLSDQHDNKGDCAFRIIFSEVDFRAS